MSGSFQRPVSIVPHAEKLEHWDLVMRFLESRSIKKNNFFNHLVHEVAIAIHNMPEDQPIEALQIELRFGGG
jgi:hypothetical protein